MNEICKFEHDRNDRYIVKGTLLSRKATVTSNRQISWKCLMMQALLQMEFSGSYQPLVGEMTADNSANTQNAEKSMEGIHQLENQHRIQRSQLVNQNGQTSQVNIVFLTINEELPTRQVVQEKGNSSENQSIENSCSRTIMQSRSFGATRSESVKRSNDKQEENTTVINKRMKILINLNARREVHLFCCENDKMRRIFEKVPFDSFCHHKDMYLKTMRTFMHIK